LELRKYELTANQRLKELNSGIKFQNSSDKRFAEYHDSHLKSNLASSYVSSDNVSFKEVVEIFAEKNAMSFTPRLGRYHEGKQVFQFGKSSCFIDQGVVFVSSKSANGISSWDPVSLETLLSLSK
jgi:hypothetical protein